MSNVNTLSQLEAQAAYEPEGFQDATRYLRSSIGRMRLAQDDLVKLSVSTSAKAEVRTNGAVTLAMIYVKTASGATTTGYLQLFNTSTASVTLGTTAPEMVIKLSNAANVGQAIVFYPGTEGTAFGTALSCAVTVTSGVNTTAANATNTPTILFVYA